MYVLNLWNVRIEPGRDRQMSLYSFTLGSYLRAAPAMPSFPPEIGPPDGPGVPAAQLPKCF